MKIEVKCPLCHHVEGDKEVKDKVAWECDWCGEYLEIVAQGEDFVIRPYILPYLTDHKNKPQK